jgi:branched-chain amino acid transport system ATP-binding protein
MMLEACDIEVRYGQAVGVAGATLAVAEGEWVAVIGPNGAGKTSLLRAIVGLVRHNGRVSIAGNDVTRLPAWDRHAHGLGYVPEGRQLFREMTVGENLRVGGYRLSDQEIRTAQDDVFALFPRLAERSKQIASTLSGGEQQMLALGRALMTRPRLLLIDEISWGLMPILVVQVFEALAKLHEAGLTILQVEQGAHDVLARADRGYVMTAGSIAIEGAAAELIRDRRVIESYLG